MKKTALILMVLTIVSKIVGFLRDVTLSYYYGTSGISDAYLISLTIPVTIFSFVGTGLAISYIPMYSRINREFNIQRADRFTSSVINFLLMICTLITFMGIIFAGPIVKLFASGFEGETLNRAIQFTQISIVAVYFYGIISIFKSYLQLKSSFVIPALAGIIPNLFVIFSIIISAKFDVIFLSIGTTIGVIIQLLYLIPFIRKEGYKYSFIFDTNDKYLKEIMYLSLPVIVGSSVDQINVLVDRTIASQIATGGISALNYANRLNLFIQGIFVASITTVIYPVISQMAAEKNISGLKKTLAEAISGISLLVLPATVGAMIFAEPIVKLLFGRGAFDYHAIYMTSYALYFFSIGMVGFGLREVLTRAFYALQDTKTPMINATIAMVLNIVLNIILSRYLGIGGLALATSISAILCTILLFISLRKKIGAFGIKNLTISFCKILTASIAMGLIAKYTFGTFTGSFSENISLILSICISAVVYIIMIYFMKIGEVDSIASKIRVRFFKKFI
ncbi:murein biosynthesis integral membrane protein MurJ [Dendrosporobacter sp. 1207_IL3150]|uniref:murein biosynthesis integral membrane protein MurJ n=1 Tax=Dendrosporobacter sp. 1207_IL3150 TaxID=3084054 RepID=UPI002FD9FBB1